MKNEKQNKNFNHDLNNLFERLLVTKNKRLKNVEELKRRITTKLDLEIKRLYAKKNFISDLWVKREELRLQKISVWKKFIKNSFGMNCRYILSMPFIYMMIIPAIILHITTEIYHRVCFRLYGIPMVEIKEYFIFDRHLLPYLNWFEKFNCFYCSYFNCLISYVKEISARTERYWCPIKHSRPLKDEHSQYDKFVDYSDGEVLRKQWNRIRKF
ncbi:hypothetical protein A2331_03330 [Candidatus Falkowbacteria bacterium RIFOXYB2_FULL_34_18]|uniref:Uncharacterized protein n=1 Tax=Candidatus Falkowbacteria bacterium RIFOXYD2_FULL_34_120 TaxID=1798007 RepID=A0A1F5TNT5_9BACT|nr:MAG: hypothetical protein A2331_03330 [Candidatus Falkowbacteria bacterium RIFOXYB2_FULL_34_18]OGF28947.1 MAG: hypothetical protein A2500_01730 [Candidatus Falkowbacteria bacterium RIFOXYC12_FULL_34_55]OGF35854.1 MAG: hypothetical protein A2466_03650 [Candidatus Falkowbacteria bacterium RIFOXYC2_FULL_34_220]OGF38461.1 MAG: hypothetical protein A2515_07020 [Candidatus Falkowbacteria bacterium RIFOXYD12_FULL_34_57]OGF40527.1 MAG: hypothetical protein A2531_04435 [Candidatus Falkowbacteria bact